MRHPLGLKVPADYQITTYEPCRELALETTSGGPVHPTQRYELTRTPDGGTILRSVIEYQAQGLVRFAPPLSLVLDHAAQDRPSVGGLSYRCVGCTGPPEVVLERELAALVVI